jgi:hypothetical protein
VDSLSAFVERKGIAALPPDERVVVEPALPFDIGFASMHASPPMEKTPVRSIYRITEPPLDMPTVVAEADLMTYVTRLGPAGAALREADDATRAKVTEALSTAFQPFVRDGEARFTSACWLVTARA